MAKDVGFILRATCFSVTLVFIVVNVVFSRDLCHFVCSMVQLGGLLACAGVLHDEDGVDVSGGWRGDRRADCRLAALLTGEKNATAREIAGGSSIGMS